MMKNFLVVNIASYFLLVLSSFNNISNVVFVNGQVKQDDESKYLANFNQIMEASYSQVDDMSKDNINKPPQALLNQCKDSGKTNPTLEVFVSSGGGSVVVSTSVVQRQCGTNTICIIPEGISLRMDGSLNVGALIIRGNLEWNDSTQNKSNDLFLCGGYAVVENNGSFEMDLGNNNNKNKKGWIYIKNNGAVHPELRSRAFGTFKERYNQNQNPIMMIRGRQDLKRTWSLLSEPLYKGDNTIKLMHSPSEMGWNVGDRIGISPTDNQAVGWGQDVYITDINKGVITINTPIKSEHRADFEVGNLQYVPGASPALLSAEVINLSRNIIITGDDFEEIACDPSLPEAVNGEQTSVKGCRCASFRTTCTVGLHTMHKFGGGGDDGITRIENVRVEKCGQRGVEGKYCMHFHKMDDCPNCIFKGNAIENSQQRGIIIHSTHNTLVEDNVLYNVRGANIYLEDGNEMWNTLKYNVAICPFPFRDTSYHGCTVSGTSNRVADTADNQSGFFLRAGSNNFIGNRASNHFNGMFLQEGGRGRGDESYNKVCESASRLGRFDGNTWHSNGRFGTYTLGFNYPKVTDQSIANNGYNTNMEKCKSFDSRGNTQGLSCAFVNHVDYGNGFVGHYSGGDLQHYGHQSIDNDSLIYWKETKTFANGCGSHLINGHYKKGTMALPDQATFIIDNVVIGDDTRMEANHHCNVGTTGVLCMPTYILHKVKWENNYSKGNRGPLMYFQKQSFQETHNNNQNHGGIFTLSPDDASIVLDGGTVEGSVFPRGFISLVSDKFPYLLGLPNNLCIDTSAQENGILYDNGIMCKTELRALKVYSRGLSSSTAPQLKVEIWYDSSGKFDGSPAASQLIGFHQIGPDGSSKKQGYSVPVIKGQAYRISLTSGDLPNDWVIEFSDPVIGNRWIKDELYLDVAGRNCKNNGLITSNHDRKYIWGGDIVGGYLDDKAWFNHGACVGSGQQPPDESSIDCGIIVDTNNNDNNNNNSRKNPADQGVVEATSCPKKCSGGCNSNSYCDCGLEMCECKAGYTGSNCEIDLCSDANCGEHGSCSARYLGGALAVTNKACVCENTWLGERCDKNPCAGIDCSGNGECIAVSENEAMCECQDGYLGAQCEDRSKCEEICQKGSFPYFGCGSNIQGMVALGCYRTGGCRYLKEGDNYPYDGFCTYKTYTSEILLPTPISPVSSPIDPPVVVDPNPDQEPTSPTPSPISVPSPPTNPPKNDFNCGCSSCTDTILGRDADGYSCGSRIEWLQTADGYNELDSCRKVSEEFPDICTCTCGRAPTRSPTRAPETCTDSDKLKYKNKKKRSCKWLGNRNNIRKWCRRKWKRKKLSKWCPETCSKVGVGKC